MAKAFLLEQESNRPAKGFDKTGMILVRMSTANYLLPPSIKKIHQLGRKTFGEAPWILDRATNVDDKDHIIPTQPDLELKQIEDTRFEDVVGGIGLRARPRIISDSVGHVHKPSSATTTQDDEHSPEIGGRGEQRQSGQ